ncbi:ATP-binding cassette domain-containing protein [Trueperella pyogenes]|uniref:ATP-binding cassette domain-containing protein n=1 Tax=Trueperella pyogenes TaxID=1661 RepID=A0A3Q9GIJ1_9ACTO|nr:ATP-binding cassette domain-containing protein [Trueperella pyogenes]AZR06812.1 ATP-binding cassette domain-containing protein [Trueperella pyogenes]
MKRRKDTDRRGESGQPIPLNDDGSVLRAQRLAASSVYGPIFGPLDLCLKPGTLCIVHGTSGSGRSALLLALAGHLRRVTGSLEVAGYDAAAAPLAVIENAGVGRIGQYAAPDDRLTVAELIAERALYDGASMRTAIKRVEQIEDWLGYQIDREALYQELPGAEKAVLCAVLAMVRPAAVVVVDGVDQDVPAHQLVALYEALQHLAAFDGHAVIVSATNADAAPLGAVRVHLVPKKASRVHKIEEPPVSVDTATEAPTPAEALDAGRDGEIVVVRVGEEAEGESEAS